MHEIKEFLELGEPSSCLDLNIMQAVHEQLPLFQYTSPLEIQDRMKEVFEGNNRYEYSVRDDDGTLLALMVFTCDDREAHIGMPVMVAQMSFSLVPGLLARGYRFLFQKAREHGIRFVKLPRMEGMQITSKFVDLGQ